MAQDRILLKLHQGLKGDGEENPISRIKGDLQWIVMDLTYDHPKSQHRTVTKVRIGKSPRDT